MMQIKTALITDLDNTLFDWVELWFKCFSCMLDGIVKMSGIPKEKLIPEISAVYQRHGTSEYSFLIEELPSLQPILNGRSATEMFAAPIEDLPPAAPEVPEALSDGGRDRAKNQRSRHEDNRLY